MSQITNNEIHSDLSRLTEKVDKLDEKLNRLFDLVKRIPSNTTVYYDPRKESTYNGDHR